MFGGAGSERGSLLSPPTRGDASCGIQIGRAGQAKTMDWASKQEDPIDPCLLGDPPEQARTEASRDAPATSAGVRARHESSRDGHEADDGTGDAGEAERKTINAGRPRGGKRNAAEARSRESEGRSVGLAEERTGEGKNNAGGGSARRPTWYEKTGTGEAVGEREDLAELRRRAWRFQDDTQAQDKEDFDGVGVGGHLYDELRNSRSLSHRAETKANKDVEQASVMPYDVQMDLGDGVYTTLDKYAAVDVQHVRTHPSPDEMKISRTDDYKAGSDGNEQGRGDLEGESSSCKERISGEKNAVRKSEELQKREDSEDDVDCSRAPDLDSGSSEIRGYGSCSGESEQYTLGEGVTRKRRARSHREGTIEGKSGDKRKRRHGISNKNNGVWTGGGYTDRGGQDRTTNANAGAGPGGELFARREGNSEDRARESSTLSIDRQLERTAVNGRTLKVSTTCHDGTQEESLFACGHADQIARPGRTFDVAGTPKQTWNLALDTLIGELTAAGHGTLQRNLKKRTADKSRYNYCEVLCKHSGKPRRKAPTPAEATPRRSASQKMGCPFKVVITWPLRESNPSISSAFCQHSHDPRGLAPSAAEEHTLPPSIIGERMDDVRRWTASDLSAKEIIQLLETEHDGLQLCKAGKRKVYNVIRKVKDELCSILEDASDIRAASGSEPGVDYEHARDAQGKLVDTSGLFAEEELDKDTAKIGDCLQQRVYESMMAKSKDYVEDVMRSLPPHEALVVQDKVGEYVRLLLKSPAGHKRPNHPRQAVPEGAEGKGDRWPASFPGRWERRSQGLSRQCDRLAELHGHDQEQQL